MLHCTVLHWTALCCTALHCAALHWNILYWTGLRNAALHCNFNAPAQGGAYLAGTLIDVGFMSDVGDTLIHQPGIKWNLFFL